MAYNLKLLSKNFNGLNSSKTQIKTFKYFRENIANNGIFFLWETHSSYDTVINWRDDIRGELFFSYGTMNPCGVMIS